jgi:hypothetical protein
MEREDREFSQKFSDVPWTFRYFFKIMATGLGNETTDRCPECGCTNPGAWADARDFLPVLRGYPDNLFLLFQGRAFRFIVPAHKSTRENEMGGICAVESVGFMLEYHYFHQACVVPDSLKLSLFCYPNRS